jgi:hypothetical protein
MRFLLARNHPEDRKCLGHLFKIRHRRILVHGQVGSCSRCSLQVRPQDRGATPNEATVAHALLSILAIQLGRCPRYNQRVKSPRVIESLRNFSFLKSSTRLNSFCLHHLR